MSATDTPRTDSAYADFPLRCHGTCDEATYFARQLERDLTAANARADDLQTRLDNLRQNYSDAQQMLDAGRVDAGKWRTRCIELAMKHHYVIRIDDGVAIAARDAGKDE